MLAGGLSWAHPSTWASTAGALSFPIYGFHAPILVSVSLAGLSMGWGVALCFAAAWLFSWLSARHRQLAPMTAKSVQTA